MYVQPAFTRAPDVSFSNISTATHTLRARERERQRKKQQGRGTRDKTKIEKKKKKTLSDLSKEPLSTEGDVKFNGRKVRGPGSVKKKKNFLQSRVLHQQNASTAAVHCRGESGDKWIFESILPAAANTSLQPSLLILPRW